MDLLLGIDIGTTHCKVGLFNIQGEEIKTAIRKTVTCHDRDGSFFNPDDIWRSVVDMIRETVPEDSGRIAAIGIASMAETGLLLDRESGAARTDFLPWFDRRAQEEAEQIANEADALEQFSKTGLHPSYKYGLAKILWLKKRDPEIVHGAVWLSAADYVAYRLTGEFGTDPTLASRTYAYRIDQKTWDTPWIRHFGLEETLFPEVFPSGQPFGKTSPGCGLPEGIPVAVAGHDHVCAALSVGAVKPGVVFDSVGTAETLIGTLHHPKLGKKELRSGLSYGCHVAGGRYFWMGGLSASGGSLEWLRTQVSNPPLSYETVEDFLSKMPAGPTGILYFPYLSGSGAPCPDPNVKAAFIGLTADHKKEDLIKAVLEGTAYEMESIRRSAVAITDEPIRELAAVGGGTQNQYWMQIKSDVAGCPFSIPAFSEATLLGAALAAGIGSGQYKDEEEAISAAVSGDRHRVIPDQDRHKAYQFYYKNGYTLLQKPLRQYYS